MSTEKITERQEPMKFYRMTTTWGVVIRFQAEDMATAQAWCQRQFDAMHLNYPNDLAELKEETWK